MAWGGNTPPVRSSSAFDYGGQALTGPSINKGAVLFGGMIGLWSRWRKGRQILPQSASVWESGLDSFFASTALAYLGDRFD